jgi:hypothetical protein
MRMAYQAGFDRSLILGFFEQRFQVSRRSIEQMGLDAAGH